ncbi:carbohydrate kinase family protein [Meiothermus hypogaeus]|uniref:Carbohydrate kinase n=2 Tax=Meiothermus hypogaeus TaxID=884155 RepID=A0A511QYT8_9DEIN|nr:carbohydrate kinase [Meiothermus hypogaeus]RIH80314.1 Fructokinase [Meiothermus hypogaeus]GEM82535.1 carbohydrate kinase [Meiothermus hypogaeus NBRC 106114]GIW36116.1 MAG: carbohydrate kinase [Meiothermus sp.]
MLIVAGEALIDMTPTAHHGATAYVPHPGGSPYNVAMGAGRLGTPTAFLGRISRDAFGQLLRRHLAESKVSLEYVKEGQELTTLALVTPSESGEFFSFYCENTADRLLYPEDLPTTLPPQAALHFGSYSLVLEPGASSLERLMRREARRRLITLDPNVRPFLIPNREAYLERLSGWLEQVDLVKVSQADLEWLYPGESLESVAQAWQKQGPVWVIVTRGGQGAFAVRDKEIIRVQAPQVQVVDTVGAGDAFMSGTLSWLWQSGVWARAALESLSSEQITALLHFAARVAAITCTRAGANPPWRDELA